MRHRKDEHDWRPMFWVLVLSALIGVVLGTSIWLDFIAIKVILFG